MVSPHISAYALNAFKKGINRWRARRAGNKIAQAVKEKIPYSYTKTMTKKKNERKYANYAETGLNARSLGIARMYKRRATHGKLLGTYHYNNINQWVFTSLQGHQEADFPECIMTRSQLIGDTNASRGERYRYADNPFNLNPFYARPASALYTADSGVSRTDCLYIKKVQCRLDLLSMIKVPMEVRVYFLTPKYDTDINPIDQWNNILSAKSLGQTTQVGITTLASAADPTPGTSQRIDYGENPFYHREFRANWIAVKSTRLLLQAGEQINLSVGFDYEKIISRCTLVEQRTQQFLKGLTVFPLIIIKAALQGLVQEGAGEAAQVSYAEAKIGMVMNQRLLFGALPQSRFSMSRTYTGQIVNDTTDTGRVIDDQDVIIPVKPDL